jgi:hypothetical protein
MIEIAGGLFGLHSPTRLLTFTTNQEVTMNTKRFALAALAVFAAMNAFGFFVHGFLLFNDYSSIPDLMRAPEDANRHMMFMQLANVVSALAIVWVYAQGLSDKPWLGQGIRFGIALWALTSVHMFLINYTVQPFPGMLVAKQVAFEFVGVTLLGVVAAAVYRREGAARQASA